MVVVSMHHAAALRIGRNHQQRNPRAVAEEVDRLHITGIPVAATFVEGDHDRGVVPHLRDWPEPCR